MSKSHVARIERLESIMRTGGDEVFVAWGRDKEAARQELASAFERGAVGKGDLAIATVWPHAGDLPVSRWTTYRDLGDREHDAIIETIRVGLGISADVYSLAASRPTDDTSIMQMTADEIFCCLAQRMSDRLGMPTEPGGGLNRFESL